MQATDLQLVAALVHARAGIVLGADKAYLIRSRLGAVARRLGFADLECLLAAMRRTPSETLLHAVTEALTTNETSFFRDGRPFEQLTSLVLPRLVEARADQRTLRIWSAAASTGQEAYSIAMCLEEYNPPLSGWRISIIGTDIATAALDRARQGRYSAFEVQRGLTPERLARHFTRVGDAWQVDERLARRIEFRAANLVAGCRQIGQFDIIFLRNVLIYFDLETRRRILSEVRSMLATDGYLFLGGTETVLGVSDAFVPWCEARGIVRPVPTDSSRTRSAPAGPPTAGRIMVSTPAAGEPNRQRAV